MKWFFLLLWDPVTALDLHACDGKIDHGKIIGFTCFLLMYGLIPYGLLPSVGHTIALLSAGFGWAGWRAFLAAKTVMSSETVTRDVTEILDRRHIDADGITTDPIP